MTDRRFEEFIKREARRYNEPPPTPREELWSRITAARRASPKKPRRFPGLIQIAMGVAAVLLVGIGIGRWSASDQPPAVAPVGTWSEAGGFDEVEIYRVAAMDHLDQLDMFITLFQSDADAGRTDSTTGVWARDLLMTTRLMMDSPAGDDPGLRELLEDLELILAQIADYAVQRDDTELELIQEDLEDDGILLRLKAELAVNSVDVSAQGEI